MQYSVLRKYHIPIGSDITEAACKTVFTQRLKLSGMRWTRAGARRILLLRTLLLSNIWGDAYERALAERTKAPPRPYAPKRQETVKSAA